MSDPLLGMRFAVLFLAGGVVPNPLDIRFQRVSGLSMTVDTEPLREGGQNLYTQQLPTGVSHGNLVLEGTAASTHAAEAGGRAPLLAELGWKQVEKILQRAS